MMAIRDLGHEIVVACDPNDSVGIIDSISPNSEFFTDFEIFEEYAHTIQDSQSPIDYVSICSPNYLHAAHIAAGLRLGCDVICEKPLVPDTASIAGLRRLEEKHGKRVFNILQLRHHPAILALREQVRLNVKGDKHDVELTYVTSRGSWYSKSWKADSRRSFGVMMNIGIHFFDMLNFIFGPCIDSKLHLMRSEKAAGYLEYEGAQVRWFLSIDEADLPDGLATEQRTFRNITCDGTPIEFSGGFTDLHTVSYENIIAGRGYGLSDAKLAISTVEQIYETPLSDADNSSAHPMLRCSTALDSL